MMRKLVSLFLVAALVAVPFSCATEMPDEPRGETPRAIESAGVELAGLEEELEASAEVRELLGMLEEAAARLAERGMTVDDLARLQAEGPEEAMAALGYSQSESAVLGQRLEELRDALYGRFPALAALAPGPAGIAAESGIPRLTDDEYSVPLDLPVKGTNTPTCQWTPYILALLTCANAAIAAANLALYFVCAFQALCSYCEGGWVNDACS